MTRLYKITSLVVIICLIVSLLPIATVMANTETRKELLFQKISQIKTLPAISIEDKTNYEAFVETEHEIRHVFRSSNYMYPSDDKTMLIVDGSLDKDVVVYEGQLIGNVHNLQNYSYFVDNNKILRIDANATEIFLIYQAQNNISYLDAVDEMLFFVSDNYLYSISSVGVGLKKICEVNAVTHVRALSSTKVLWSAVNPDATSRDLTQDPDPNAISGDLFYVHDTVT